MKGKDYLSNAVNNKPQRFIDKQKEKTNKSCPVSERDENGTAFFCVYQLEIIFSNQPLIGF